ncbi:MAG: MlaD family protein [Syntrophales bacterium]
MTTNLKVGLFLTIMALLAIVFLSYMAHKKGIFEPTHTFTLSSKTGEDLAEGMPIHFAGFRIGRIDELELNDQGMVIIKVKVPRRHIKWIRTNSIFSLYKPLIGSPRLIVSTENMTSPVLPEDKVLELVVVNDINEAIKQLTPIIEEVGQIVSHIETITGNLADPKGSVNKILRNAEQVTANFTEKKSIAEMALGDPESVKSLHESVNKIRDILVKLDDMAGKTDVELYGKDGVLPLVRSILADVLVKLQKLNKALDNITKVTDDAAASTKDLNLLRNDIDATIQSIGRTVEDLDRIVPLKKEREIKLP